MKQEAVFRGSCAQQFLFECGIKSFLCISWCKLEFPSDYFIIIKFILYRPKECPTMLFALLLSASALSHKMSL